MSDPKWQRVSDPPPDPREVWVYRKGCWGRARARRGADGRWILLSSPAWSASTTMLDEPTHWAPIEDDADEPADLDEDADRAAQGEMTDEERVALGKRIMDITRGMCR